MRKAVIDVGSNSVLLVVEELTSEGWVQIHESAAVTALGAGTKASGLLGEEGIQHTLVALSDAFRKATELGASSTEAAVTMAARIATNAQDFLNRCKQQGTPVFILSGEQEAELGFQAVANDPVFSSFERLSIIDVGGQSTELVTAQRTSHGWDTKFRKSFAIGTLALKGGVLHAESPGPSDLLNAVQEIDEQIGMCYSRREAGVAIVLGATGTNLITIREKMTTWEPEKVNGQLLSFGEISEAVGSMMPLTDEQRRNIVGMEPGREKSLHIGALILERFLQAIGAPGCYVSVRGWRHALLESGLPK